MEAMQGGTQCINKKFKMIPCMSEDWGCSKATGRSLQRMALEQAYSLCFQFLKRNYPTKPIVAVESPDTMEGVNDPDNGAEEDFNPRNLD